MPDLAGVPLDEEEIQGLALTVAMPDLPIIDADTGTMDIPADDLAGFITRSLGLEPATLAEHQRTDIQRFISTHSL